MTNEQKELLELLRCSDLQMMGVPEDPDAQKAIMNRAADMIEALIDRNDALMRQNEAMRADCEGMAKAADTAVAQSAAYMQENGCIKDENTLLWSLVTQVAGRFGLCGALPRATCRKEED